VSSDEIANFLIAANNEDVGFNINICKKARFKMFYSPFKNSVYRAVWIALLFSNIGTWIHTVTGSLLMTKLTASPALIALVQTSAMLPIFIFAIPAGVIADLYSRKSIVIISQSLMSILAFAMALITYLGGMTDVLLLLTTFLLNIGLAFNQPAWQALSSTLVPTSEIKQSAALNNLSFNLSRCIGPALAGFCFSKIGPASLFALNGLSFIGVIFVFAVKVQTDQISNLNVASIADGIQDTFRFFRQYPDLKFIILKSFMYFSLASSVWALLPFVIVIYNHMSDSDLGLLTAAAGIGAVMNAYLIYHLRKYFNDMQMTTGAIFLSGIVILVLSRFTSISVLFSGMIVFGFSWSLSVSVFNGLLQSEFPREIRSRLIGIYFVFFAAAQVLGSFAIGKSIQLSGLHETLNFYVVATFAIWVCYVFGFLSEKNITKIATTTGKH